MTGFVIFVYALVWLLALSAGFLLTGRIFEPPAASVMFVAARALWFSILAGGIGAAVGMFYSLYWHIY